jgi:hypothetical protein
MTHVYNDSELGIFYVVDKKGRKIRERKVKKSKRSRPHWADSIKEEVTTSLPGSGRVDDLAAFYDANAASEVSPFTFEFE